jgi:hypothetical protein
VPIVLKSGRLSLLEPSGPEQASDGIALPLPFYMYTQIHSVIALCWVLCNVRTEISEINGEINVTNLKTEIQGTRNIAIYKKYDIATFAGLVQATRQSIRGRRNSCRSKHYNHK